MIFSAGDLITLVVVLLVLVIYRAMDRNNRSLEKLKRFTDKITENLSAVVEQKTAEVRDLSLELQASLKMGKEILVRARGVEELLQGKASDIEEIQNRFAQYDKALAELSAMSTRVDKNLARIREESEYVDEVGRRIGESAERLDAIERRIPALEEELSAKARSDLREARGEVMAGVEQAVAGIAQQLSASESKVKDFSTYVGRLEARQEQTDKERLAAMGRAQEEFDAALRGKLSSAAQRGASLEDEVFARLSSRIQEDEAAIARSIQTIESRLSDYQGDVDYRIKTLEESGPDVEALKDSLVQSMEKVAAGVRSQMKVMASELVAGWTTEIAASSSAREQVRSGVAELEQGLSDLKTRAYQDVSGKLSVFEDEFFADLRKRSTGMQERVATWQEEMDGRFTAFEKDLKDRIAAADESLTGLREGMREETEKARKDASASFEKDLTGVKDALEAGTGACTGRSRRGSRSSRWRWTPGGKKSRSCSKAPAPRSRPGRERPGSSSRRRSLPSRRRSPRCRVKHRPPSGPSATGLRRSARICW